MLEASGFSHTGFDVLPLLGLRADAVNQLD